MNPARVLAVCLLAAGVPQVARAGGFAIGEHDTAATGRGGTVIGHARSATGIIHNPASLGGLRGPSGLAGVTSMASTVTAGDPAGGPSATMPLTLAPVPHFAFAFGVGDFAVGAGFNVPFGGSVHWPKGWRGRYELEAIDLQVLAGHVGGAWRVFDRLSLGAVATLAAPSVVVDRRVDFVNQEGGVHLEMSSFAPAGRVGLLWGGDDDRLHVGAYGSIPTATTLRGTARFKDVPAPLTPMAHDQKISAPFHLPARAGVGAELSLGRVRISSEVEQTFWSTFESFGVDFEDATTPDVVQRRDWQDTLTARLGFELDLASYVLRLGVFYDQQTSPPDTLSPMLPDSNRLGGGLGGGRGFGWGRLDVAYATGVFFPRASSAPAFPADYTAIAHMLACTARFGDSEAP